MKKNLFFVMLLLICSIVISYSCTNTIEESMEIQQGEKRIVKVKTRSTAAEIAYPLTLYAFRNSDGKLVTSTVAEGAESDMQMVLPEGSYKIVAMAGTSGLTVPTAPSLSTDIGIPSGGPMSSAVQIGRADKVIGKQDSEVNIFMAYQVAQVNLKLQDIPENVTAVRVALSTLNTGLTFGGSFSGSGVVELQLEKSTDNSGRWTAPTVYLLPGVSNTQLTLSIELTSSKSTTYAYTHTTTLMAGTPYELTGSYNGSFILSGIISAAGWSSPEEIGFSFGPEIENGNVESDNTENPEDNEGMDNDATLDEDWQGGDLSDEVYYVNSIPEKWKLWEGHLVADVINTSSENNSADILLMSLAEWETTIDNSSMLDLDAYSEGKIQNWRIPTENELTKALKTIVSKLDDINRLLAGLNGDEFEFKYFFCDNFQKVMPLSTSPISKSPSASSSYSLRLVKTVKVRVNTGN